MKKLMKLLKNLFFENNNNNNNNQINNYKILFHKTNIKQQD